MSAQAGYVPPRRAPVEADCRVCLGKHDAKIHAATISIHSWFRARLALVLVPIEKPASKRRHGPGGPGVCPLTPELSKRAFKHRMRKRRAS
jgi:hypothetical protein